MNRTIIASAILASLALAGCATRPENIVAAPMASGCSPNKAEDVANLDRLVKAQGKAATTDVVTVVLVGVPFSKLAGADNEKEIARLKACVAR